MPSKKQKRTPLDEVIERLADWHEITPASVRDIHAEVEAAVRIHDCDDHAKGFGDGEYECQLCGNSWAT